MIESSKKIDCIEKDAKIFVAGHQGLVGSALTRKLHEKGFNNLVLRTRAELDLTDQPAVNIFFKTEKPEYVFLAAAKVGGIYANNTYPADFIFSNMQVQMNIINESWKYKVKKLMFLGSSCFIKNSIINTPKEYKYIQNIKIGDKVLTHRGLYKKVYKIFKRKINEKILIIRPYGWNKIECTKKHKIYTQNDGFKKAENLKKGDILKIPLNIKKSKSKFINIFIDKKLEKLYDAFLYFKKGHLNISDLIKKHNITPNIVHGWKRGSIPHCFLIKNKIMNLEKELGFISGFFLADGHISGKLTGKRGGSCNIGFSCGKNKKLVNLIIKELSKIVKHKIYVTKKPSCETITLSNKILFNYFSQFYNGYSRGMTKGSISKIIPDFIKNNESDKVIKNFIKGYWKGDGHFSKRKNRENQFLAVTASTSQQLIYDLQNMLARLGILASVYIKKQKKKRKLLGRTINQKTQYHLRITGKWAMLFGKNILDISLIIPSKKYLNNTILKKDAIFLKIKTIKNKKYKGFVYDLSVEKDQTYTCNGFIVHNCIYPRYSPQPINEDCLLSGKLEPTNESYALAKIAGIIMCKSYNKQYGTNFISVMPTNLYGPNDNYHQLNSHVLPALIRKFHEAKINNLSEVIIWGTGNPTREFLYSEDLADACIFLMEKHNGNDIINIGSGEEITIRELAMTIKKTVGYKGNINFDVSKPDGTPRKLLDSSKLYSMGWRHTTELEKGITLTYIDFLRMLKDPKSEKKF